MAAAGEESWGLAPGESAPGRGAAVSRQRSGRRSAGEPPDTLRPAGLPPAPTPGAVPAAPAQPRSLSEGAEALARPRRRGLAAGAGGKHRAVSLPFSRSVAVREVHGLRERGRAAGGARPHGRRPRRGRVLGG